MHSIKRFIISLENLKLTNKDRAIILAFLIFLRNLLESQFEFPGYLGFVKIPVDSFLAFFLHFPLFYIALFYSLFIILSSIRGDKEKIANVLTIGFSIILIPPLFDYIVIRNAYHLSYFFEPESFSKSLIGILIPWIGGIKNVSPGQRIEVYLGVVLIFTYLLLSNRGILRGLLGFFTTYLLITGFGASGIVLTPFLKKNWLLFSHHQVFIQFFTIIITIIYYLKNRKDIKFDLNNIILSLFFICGFIYCLKLKLPLEIPPFLFLSLLSLLLSINLAQLGVKLENTILIILGGLLAISVRYETLIFYVGFSGIIYLIKLTKTNPLGILLFGLAGVSSLYIGTSIFFFYRTISLTPLALITLVFVSAIFVRIIKKWYLVAMSLILVLIITFFIPGRRLVTEHYNTLGAIDALRKNRYEKIVSALKESKSDNLINFLKGIAFVNTGFAQIGLGHLKRIPEAFIDRNVIYAQLAGANQLRDYETGLKVLDQGIKMGIMLDDLYLEKVRQLLLLKDFTRAMATIDSAYLFGASFYDCLLLMGDVALYKKDLKKAIKIFEEANKRNPADYYPYAQQGLLQFELCDYDSSIKLFKKALNLEDTDAVVHNNYGVVLRTTKNFKDARKEFLRALELSPNLVDAYYNLGLLCLMEEKKDEAIYWLERLLKINPEFLPAKDILLSLKSDTP